MKKCELDYFQIGISYGGNQKWFRDYWMNLGGCAALAACDSCIQLELNHVKKGLLPDDIKPLTQDSYVKFGMQMKSYLRPRWSGITRLEIYVDGMKQYLSDIGNDSLKMKEFSSDNSLSDAINEVQFQINHGFSIPYLLLRHKNSSFRSLLWHWFMIVGFQWLDEELYIKIATYGGYNYVLFHDLWNSGYKNNGGMIFYI